MSHKRGCGGTPHRKTFPLYDSDGFAIDIYWVMKSYFNRRPYNFKRLPEKVVASRMICGGKGFLEGACPSNSPFSDSF
jgi:hypothetical protein